MFYHISVQTLDGNTYEITLDSLENTVKVLKEELQKKVGTLPLLQQLYLIQKNDPKAHAQQDQQDQQDQQGQQGQQVHRSALKESHIFTEPCSLVLCVEVSSGFSEWIYVL
jgi:hypothetical protein